MLKVYDLITLKKEILLMVRKKIIVGKWSLDHHCPTEFSTKMARY